MLQTKVVGLNYSTFYDTLCFLYDEPFLRK